MRLTEIEARWNRKISGSHGFMAGDVHLLIRAVRQLGALANAVLESKTEDDGFVFPKLGYPPIDTAYDAIDPDVLELLEEEK